VEDIDVVQIYVVNLKRREDRRQQMITQFKRYNITNYQFIDAVDGHALTDDVVNSVYDARMAKRLLRELTRNELGCAMSHRMIYEAVDREQVPYAIILEDDAIITPEFVRFVTSFSVDSLPQFDCLLLGYLYADRIPYRDVTAVLIGDTTFFRFDDAPSGKREICGTHGYMITAKSANKLLSLCTPIVLIADYVWNIVPSNVKLVLYGTSPPIVHVDASSTSDIEPERLSTTTHQVPKHVARWRNNRK
jgi:glycosyl transferase, family 25